jgi:hypothetical protein
LSQTPHLLLFSLVLDRACVFAWAKTSDLDPPTSTSWVAEITGIYHHAWPSKCYQLRFPVCGVLDHNIHFNREHTRNTEPPRPAESVSATGNFGVMRHVFPWLVYYLSLTEW